MIRTKHRTDKWRGHSPLTKSRTIRRRKAVYAGSIAQSFLRPIGYAYTLGSAATVLRTRLRKDVYAIQLIEDDFGFYLPENLV
jgi:hypothetical protein